MVMCSLYGAVIHTQKAGNALHQCLNRHVGARTLYVPVACLVMEMVVRVKVVERQIVIWAIAVWEVETP